jgi:hypothetical protein
LLTCCFCRRWYCRAVSSLSSPRCCCCGGVVVMPPFHHRRPPAAANVARYCKLSQNNTASINKAYRFDTLHPKARPLST